MALRRRTKVAIVVTALATPVILLGGVWIFLAVVGGDAAPSFELSEPAEDDPVQVEGSAAGRVDGSWEVVGGGASEAGYRIDEEVPIFPDPNTVVGRTTAVEGSMTITDSVLVSVDVSADLSQLDSGEPRRENSLADRYLEFNTYPIATFELTEPLPLGEVPGPGESLEATASGELTLHGVTDEVEVQIDAQLLSDGRIEVVGSAEIVLADYDIERPDILGFVTVKETGLLEVRLIMQRSSDG